MSGSGVSQQSGALQLDLQPPAADRCIVLFSVCAVRSLPRFSVSVGSEYFNYCTFVWEYTAKSTSGTLSSKASVLCS